MLHYTIHSVEVIAYETGFNDPAYFLRFFSKMMGQSPASRRRLQAQMQDDLPGMSPR